MSYEEQIPETGSDGMTLDQTCPDCGRAKVVVLPACCKYQRMGWDIIKKCPLLCGYWEGIIPSE